MTEFQVGDVVRRADNTGRPGTGPYWYMHRNYATFVSRKGPW